MSTPSATSPPTAASSRIFPRSGLIWSVGSGYGGNALLGKKCHALRLGSWQAREEGWLAEHMLILGLEDPEGRITYLAAAMPSASGKTNLSMLVSKLPGYRVWTVGDDIAWIHVGPDGRLRAINPERGFFGVAPQTSEQTNPNAMAMIRSNTIFTNVATTPSGEPWWEGIGTPPPAGLLDWQGRDWAPGGAPAAHPNSRFTVPRPAVPVHRAQAGRIRSACRSRASSSARGWPACSRSCRRPSTGITASSSAPPWAPRPPRPSRARSASSGAIRWPCSRSAATTWATTSATGSAWARGCRTPPRIFRVNWFRRDGSGRFLWPGYGDNVRVLKWIVDRIHGEADARETPIGYVPTPGALELDGLNIAPDRVEAALHVERDEWTESLQDLGEFYRQFGSRLPAAISAELATTARRLTT